jgi:hypothetical protein
VIPNFTDRGSGRAWHTAVYLGPCSIGKKKVECPRFFYVSFIASVINCNTRHAGQIEYLSGLVKYGGWFPGAEK